MRFLKSKWRHMTWPQRIAFVVGVPCAAALMLLAVLHIANIRTTSLSVYAVLVSVLMLSQALEHWKANRKAAWISLGAAALVVVAYVLTYFM